MCGGATVNPVPGSGNNGRSPCVRGSLKIRVPPVTVPRSIPVCAGEPFFVSFSCSRMTVDPRVCGGALPLTYQRVRLWGRSPCVRGSRRNRCAAGAPGRSIPVCAGEPLLSVTLVTGAGVDPRVCGGADGLLVAAADLDGRSPCVRGSLLCHHLEDGS